jgi:Restriction endonuclease
MPNESRKIRTNPFQTLIAAIEESLSASECEVIESAKIPDKATGGMREIDVLIKGKISGHELIIGIECRDHKRPQDVEWIGDLVGKYKNLEVNKVIAVSSSGFTQEALARANFEGIKTLSLVDALSEDWATLLSGYFEMGVMMPKIFPQGIRVVINGEFGTPVQDVPVGNMPIAKNGQIVGSIISYLAQYLPAELPKIRQQLYGATWPATPPREQVQISFEVALMPTNSFLVDANGTEFPLKEILVDCILVYQIEKSRADIFNYDNRAIIHGIVEMNDKSFAATIVKESPEQKPNQAKVIVQDKHEGIWRPKIKIKK